MAQNLANFEQDKEHIKLFLTNFVDPYSSTPGLPKYMGQLQEIADRVRRKLDVAIDDLQTFFEEEQNGAVGLLARIEANTARYVRILAAAADEVMPQGHWDPATADVQDVLASHRAHANIDPNNPRNRVPPELLRRYDVYLAPRSKMERSKLRGINSSHVGRLVQVKGIVTHITDVRPLAEVVVYTDLETGNEHYQKVEGRTFMPIEGDAQFKAAKHPPIMETRGSKFVKFQEARIQEMSDEVPEGATPRTMSVHLRGEICRTMKPGDEVIVTGVFMPERFVGFRAMRAGLLATTHLEALHVQQVKMSYANFNLTAADAEMLRRLGDEPDAYLRLALSIAPEIWGHEDVKKALLLQMVGGVTKALPDGMKLRGDIHFLLMGDPGVAKSQLLKYVARISPRAVYTTGKGSSGVGLTAAVLRNQVTKELVLEGGALVLADKGVCCIDEFDKMEDSDRTAIHEVMEQQTVSIAKAGITTTLNTRTTLLCAANPAFGRYDKRRAPSQNINLPAALLSRFDLLWLMLDEPSEEVDGKLAEHVLAVHRTGAAPRATGPQPVTPEVLRTYIAATKHYQPTIPPELTEQIAATYATMRQNEVEEQDQAATYTTPRTLLSILRLSQAMAKLRFDNVVSQGDIDEALRLMRMSHASIKGSGEEQQRRRDPISLCYEIICNEARKQRDAVASLHYNRIADLTTKHGLTRETIESCLQEYADIGVWAVERDQNGDPIVHINTEGVV